MIDPLVFDVVSRTAVSAQGELSRLTSFYRGNDEPQDGENRKDGPNGSLVHEERCDG
jgi:hypothetical protein